MCSAYAAQHEGLKVIYLRPYALQFLKCILIFHIIDIFHFLLSSREIYGVGLNNSLSVKII